MEAQAALVGAESGVELDAEAAVHVDVALVVGPRDAELDDALGFDDALKQGGLLELRMRVECGCRVPRISVAAWMNSGCSAFFALTCSMMRSA